VNDDLPQHVRDAIDADVARRLAEAPPPSRREIEAVRRITQQFRLAKKKASQKKPAA